MKFNVGILIFVSVLLMHCSSTDNQYDVEFLHGNWERVSSTDTRSDSMQLHIAGDSAVVTFLPFTSDFSLHQKKWFSILAVSDNTIHFTLKDVSADDSYSAAQITVESDSSFLLENVDYPFAPGALQNWIRIP